MKKRSKTSLKLSLVKILKKSVAVENARQLRTATCARTVRKVLRSLESVHEARRAPSSELNACIYTQASSFYVVILPLITCCANGIAPWQLEIN